MMYYNGLGERWCAPGPGIEECLSTQSERVLIIGSMRRLFKSLLLLALLAPLAGRPADLPKTVLQALSAVGIPESSVGAVVQEAGAAIPSLRVNSDTARNPASVMKLVTSLAALELLGPAYRWKTEAYV